MAACIPVKPESLAAEGIMPKETERRSAEYKSSLWSYQFIQSLESDFPETNTRRIQELVIKTENMLSEVKETEKKLELVDTLQKLGVAYHFKGYIDGILDSLSYEMAQFQQKCDLYHASTLFRILRDHGYEVSQDIFKRFLDEKNHFDNCNWESVDGVLSLYEATFLSHDGEDLLDEARKFSTKYLQSIQEHTNNPDLKEKIKHALEIPFHRRILRLESRWFIEKSSRIKDVNPLLVELAQLDYNAVQAMHIEEIKRVSRWWAKMGFSEHIKFNRDGIVEAWMWALGVVSYEPQFSYCRERMAQLAYLLAAIDDFYDIYGTMDEIEVFTSVIERWDINGLQVLPHYMKIVFLATFNFINETSYEVLRDKKIDISKHLPKQLMVLCKTYYQEAKWYHSQYVPSYREYINNAAISAGSPILVGFSYLVYAEDLTEATLEQSDQIPNLIIQSGIIGRLLDDKVGSEIELQRGDVHKAIECYIHHEKVTPAVARDYISNEIESAWKKMNKEKFTYPLLPKFVVDGSFNFSRICHFYYEHGDGFSSPDSFVKEYIGLLLTKKIIY